MKIKLQKEDVLRQIATKLRIHSITSTTKAGSGHPTTCLSMAELMACLFFDEMKYNVRNAHDPGNDEFVLSKGHAAPILWAAYAEAGIISVKQLEKLRVYGSPLEGHPTPNMPWIKAATGSLGQGLSVGVGMAIANRVLERPGRVFVMLGDGECAEGAVWEAASLAAKEKLKNLVVVLDVNRLGQSGESLHGHDVKSWQKKWNAFGWGTHVVDGHDIHQILDALSYARTQEHPVIIIAKTVKGKGVSFLENKEGFHGKALSNEDAQRAFQELGPMPVVKSQQYVQKPPKVKVKRAVNRSLAAPKYNSPIATREAFGHALEKLGLANSQVVALDGDVKNSTFSEKFAQAHPERFVECYIAEQNMVGVAVGMSAQGLIPFASTFAAFLTRAYDFIRMAAISDANIKLVGSHVGVSIGADGPSQMGLEEIAMMRTIPGAVVLYPSDGVSSEKCTTLLANHEGIGYLHTTRPKTDILYKSHESFKIGGSKVLRSHFTSKAVIVAAGITVHEALKAADELKKQKINVDVIDAYSVKPLDIRTIAKHARKTKNVIVVEDNYPSGALGEAVGSALGMSITHLAVRDIPRSGKPEELMRAYKIDAKAIIQAVKR